MFPAVTPENAKAFFESTEIDTDSAIKSVNFFLCSPYAQDKLRVKGAVYFSEKNNTPAVFRAVNTDTVINAFKNAGWSVRKYPQYNSLRFAVGTTNSGTGNSEAEESAEE